MMSGLFAVISSNSDIYFNTNYTKDNSFNFYCLNQDISLNIHLTSITFHMLIENILMEGTVSQNSNLGLSFNFMKSRKILITF